MFSAKEPPLSIGRVTHLPACRQEVRQSILFSITCHAGFDPASLKALRVVTLAKATAL